MTPDTIPEDKKKAILNSYVIQRKKKAIYYKTYQKTHAEQINKYNIEQYYKNREKILKQKKEYTARKKKEKEEKQAQQTKPA